MRPTPDMPETTPFQGLPPRRSSGGVRWQAEHRSIANKLVGQPQRAADTTEAELPASAFRPVAARPHGRSESRVATYRSRGQSSAIMHRVYPTANRT